MLIYTYIYCFCHSFNSDIPSSAHTMALKESPRSALLFSDNTDYESGRKNGTSILELLQENYLLLRIIPFQSRR